MPCSWWSALEDGRQATGLEVRFEACGDSHRVLYALHVRDRGARLAHRWLEIRCYEDGTVTAAWGRPEGERDA